MKDVILFISSIIGGLFLGYLAAIIAFFVWSLINEGLGNPRQSAVPALILLSWFGIGLAGLTGLVLQSWPMFLGAAITFAHGARLIFKPK